MDGSEIDQLQETVASEARRSSGSCIRRGARPSWPWRCSRGRPPATRGPSPSPSCSPGRCWTTSPLQQHVVTTVIVIIIIIIYPCSVSKKANECIHEHTTTTTTTPLSLSLSRIITVGIVAWHATAMNSLSERTWTCCSTSTWTAGVYVRTRVVTTRYAPESGPWTHTPTGRGRAQPMHAPRHACELPIPADADTQEFSKLLLFVLRSAPMQVVQINVQFPQSCISFVFISFLSLQTTVRTNHSLLFD